MRKEHISDNQLAMFVPTNQGFEQSNIFNGKYIKNKSHQTHFNGQAKFMIDNFCNGEFMTVQEWRNKTGFSEADRILRHIAKGEFPGYGREEIKAGEHHGKYRIIKLDN